MTINIAFLDMLQEKKFSAQTRHPNVLFNSIKRSYICGEDLMLLLGGYDKWVKSKSKCATTLGVFTGPLQAIWYPNWALCMKKTP